MNPSFQEIADDVSKRAANVPCSKGEYQDGLREIVERLQLDLDASEDL